MFTKNWYRLISIPIFATSSSSSCSKAVDVTGSSRNLASNATLYACSISNNNKTVRTSYSTGSGANGVMFGTGDTAPTVEDTTLSGSIITGLTISSSFKTVGDNLDDYAEISTVYLVTNTNTEDVTVREIAYVYYGCMMDRTVLDTPVTIPAGGIGQVTYTLRMNYPTA